MLHERGVRPDEQLTGRIETGPTRTARPEGRREGQARAESLRIDVAGSFVFRRDKYKLPRSVAKVHFGTLDSPLHQTAAYTPPSLHASAATHGRRFAGHDEHKMKI